MNHLRFSALILASAALVTGCSSPRSVTVAPGARITTSEPSTPAAPAFSLVSNLAAVRKSYGVDVLTLTVICRCIETLIQNVGVIEYLKRNHSEILSEPIC